MCKLKIEDVQKTYFKIKNIAFQQFNSLRYNETIHIVSLAARVAHQFCWQYTDCDLELLLKQLSEKILGKQKKGCYNHNKDRIVFYDFLSKDNRGLTEQYLNAIISWNCEFLYITEDLDENESCNIIKLLKSYDRARIIKINKKTSYVDRITDLYKIINEFNPGKIFLQLAPWSAYETVLFNAFPNIEKFYIDLADHTFNLGVSCTDYALEFRNRGYSIALEKRGLKKEQLLMLPYYPIVNKTDFKGLPNQIGKDNVILFSGGMYYKIIDQNFTYFKILLRMIEENPKLIILYAGFGLDTAFKDFIKTHSLQDRIYLLGFRNDIDQIFKRCDIYFNTYPYSGGLMCQYAAVHSKPIIAYNTVERQADFAETIICDNDESMKITYTDLDEFFTELKKLINNKQYRIYKGAQLKKNIITPQTFNQNLYNLVTTKINYIEPKFVKVDYNGIMNRMLNSANSGRISYHAWLFLVFKFKTLLISPKSIFSVWRIIKHAFLNSAMFKKKVKNEYS